MAATVYQCLHGMATLLSYVRPLSLHQQVVVVGFGPLQSATWSYHAADCQPTALVLWCCWSSLMELFTGLSKVIWPFISLF